MGEILSGNVSPFFIVGSPRSGTTLLVNLLNRHENIVIPPETAFFYALSEFKHRGKNRKKETLQDFVNVYSRWPSVKFLGIPNAEFAEILLRDARNYADLFLNLMEYLSKNSGKRRWGEKTPHHLLYVEEIRQMFTGARFICMVRDGRAVIKSRLRHPKWDDNLLSAARKWANDIKIIRKLQDRLKQDELLLIKYEDFLGEPEATLRQILSFLGEDYVKLVKGERIDDRFADFYSQPWMEKSTSSIDRSRAEAWRQDYSPLELHVVETRIGKELELMGYTRVGRAVPHWGPAYIKLYCHDMITRILKKIKRIQREMV